ncbi:hypothetical protein SNE40_016254 [Patella caerulea]|uniref:Complex III assembly factor LYRM7 n=1 Tax=Patella caerulea TaxID=87958 RepID=A0AAN8JCU1_PATCE
MATRSKVLQVFKQLHRTREKVFRGDEIALKAGREKINTEFKSNKSLTDADKIQELITIGVDSEILLRKTIVQAEFNEEENVYELKITPDTALEKNTIFDPFADLPVQRKGKRCSDKPT